MSTAGAPPEVGSADAPVHAPYHPHPLDVQLQLLLWKYTLTHVTIEPTSAPYGKAREVHVCGAR